MSATVQLEPEAQEFAQATSNPPIYSTSVPRRGVRSSIRSSRVRSVSSLSISKTERLPEAQAAKSL